MTINDNLGIVARVFDEEDWVINNEVNKEGSNNEVNELSEKGDEQFSFEWSDWMSASSLSNFNNRNKKEGHKPNEEHNEQNNEKTKKENSETLFEEDKHKIVHDRKAHINEINKLTEGSENETETQEQLAQTQNYRKDFSKETEKNCHILQKEWNYYCDSSIFNSSAIIDFDYKSEDVIDVASKRINIINEVFNKSKENRKIVLLNVDKSYQNNYVCKDTHNKQVTCDHIEKKKIEEKETHEKRQKRETEEEQRSEEENEKGEKETHEKRQKRETEEEQRSEEENEKGEKERKENEKNTTFKNTDAVIEEMNEDEHKALLIEKKKNLWKNCANNLCSQFAHYFNDESINDKDEEENNFRMEESECEYEDEDEKDYEENIYKPKESGINQYIYNYGINELNSNLSLYALLWDFLSTSISDYVINFFTDKKNELPQTLNEIEHKRKSEYLKKISLYMPKYMNPISLLIINVNTMFSFHKPLQPFKKSFYKAIIYIIVMAFVVYRKELLSEENYYRKKAEQYLIKKKKLDKEDLDDLISLFFKTTYY